MVDTNSIEWRNFRENARIKNLTKENIHDNAEWMFVLKGSLVTKRVVKYWL